ncbi:MAG: hypothetical protein ACTHZ9_07000 [Leucobacter sp.]
MKPARIFGWLIAALITGLYAYVVVIAIGSMTGMIGQGEALGLRISALGWTILLTGLVSSPLVFVLSLWFGRKHKFALRVLILAAGLCVVAVVQLDITDLVARVLPAASMYDSLL